MLSPLNKILLVDLENSELTLGNRVNRLQQHECIGIPRKRDHGFSSTLNNRYATFPCWLEGGL